MNFTKAMKQCDLIDFIHHKRNITFEMEKFTRYWTNVRRFQIKHWQDNQTDVNSLTGNVVVSCTTLKYLEQGSIQYFYNRIIKSSLIVKKNSKTP